MEIRRLFAIPGTMLGAYHSYSDLTHDLHAYAAAYPDITQLISIGKSVQNRDLWALKISDNPSSEEDEPEMKFIGSMHGDEPIGMENSLQFATMLLEGYGSDSQLTSFVNNTEIWLVPNMNPDGLVLETRTNANDVDLNRSFPEGSVSPIGNIYSGPALDVTGLQPETAAMMQWSASHSFSLSANFHSGSLLVNYPYDSNNNGTADYAACPDDALFKEISLVYARENATMTRDSIFPQGVTNGDYWYEVTGGMQDWNYRYLGDNEVTIELNYNKKPDASELASLWSDNRDSMLKYAESVHWGVRGVITRSTDNQPLFAKVTVAGNTHGVYTDPQVGDFHRMLLPGVYALSISAKGYHTRKVTGVEITGETSEADLTRRLDVRLKPIDQEAPVVTRARFAYDQNPPAVQFTFGEDVSQSVDPADIRIVNLDTRKLAKVQISTTYDTLTNAARFSFAPGALRDGNYRAVISASGIEDAWGNHMPSDQSVRFYMLGSDGNRDRIVDDQDLQIVLDHFGSAALFSGGDYDYSGAVDSIDLNLFQNRQGRQVRPLSGPVTVQGLSFSSSSLVHLASRMDLTSVTSVLS